MRQLFRELDRLAVDGREHLSLARLIAAGFHQFECLLPRLRQLHLELGFLLEQPLPLRLLDVPGREEGFGHQRRRAKHRAQLLNHGLLDVPGGNPFERAPAHGPLAVLLADVIGVVAAVLAGVGRSHRAAAVAAADDTLQRGDHFGSGHGYLDRFVVLQDGLNLVPGRPVDDPFVLAGVAAVLVGDLADIDPVVEQPVDVGGVPFGALAHLAFLGGPGLGAVPLFVQFLAQLLGRADLDEAAEDVLHRPGFIRVDQQLLVIPVDVVSEDGHAAAVFSPALGCRHLVPDTFGDDLPLVLGEGNQDAEKHPAGGIGGAEVLGDRDEADALFVEEVDHLHEVQQRAGQAVDLVDDDHIDLPGVDIRQQAA